MLKTIVQSHVKELKQKKDWFVNYSTFKSGSPNQKEPTPNERIAIKQLIPLIEIQITNGLQFLGLRK